jgi:hypothetical protein
MGITPLINQAFAFFLIILLAPREVMGIEVDVCVRPHMPSCWASSSPTSTEKEFHHPCGWRCCLRGCPHPEAHGVLRTHKNPNPIVPLDMGANELDSEILAGRVSICVWLSVVVLCHDHSTLYHSAEPPSHTLKHLTLKTLFIFCSTGVTGGWS